MAKSTHLYNRHTDQRTADSRRVRFFDNALNEVVPEKNTCVSFVQEEGGKGPLAKDLRTEDPERMARVTAEVHYGKVVVGYTTATVV